ncbi:hypothetical protein AQUCO_01600090v1 [Aquilegia coerulea]|uniref:Uncharacterized protein n=1 Tax=Aquilegia coerulea TaxID=218851 RepID=A0A2G5DQA9_AQUCA|nr:hypothetical protein AQUCO_01600090v1 [Aquilegia coerulea]
MKLKSFTEHAAILNPSDTLNHITTQWILTHSYEVALREFQSHSSKGISLNKLHSSFQAQRDTDNKESISVVGSVTSSSHHRRLDVDQWLRQQSQRYKPKSPIHYQWLKKLGGDCQMANEISQKEKDAETSLMHRLEGSKKRQMHE